MEITVKELMNLRKKWDNKCDVMDCEKCKYKGYCLPASIHIDDLLENGEMQVTLDDAILNMMIDIIKTSEKGVD